MKLAIISHTEHYLKNGIPVGWGPTVAEINHLATLFDEIWHVAVLREGESPPSALPYKTERIHFVPIKPFGGARLADKMGVLFSGPGVVSTVSQVLKKVDCWQFRAPTGIGVFLIPYLSLLSNKPGWFKYAGNWDQRNPSLGYQWQRLWLKKLQNKLVTINGLWAGQPKHCLSFENPCLTKSDRKEGAEVLSHKSYAPPWKVCFVGRVETEKGVGRILESMEDSLMEKLISRVTIIGTGKDEKRFRVMATRLKVPVVFLGTLARKEVFQIYGESHLITLPSTASEGFPKVLAEAANFGCVPVTSNVASIPQYINNGVEGCVWNPEHGPFHSWFRELCKRFKELDLNRMAKQSHEVAELFTYERYLQRIEQEILRQHNG